MVKVLPGNHIYEYVSLQLCIHQTEISVPKPLPGESIYPVYVFKQIIHGIKEESPSFSFCTADLLFAVQISDA